MKTSDFSFELPDHLIARHPAAERSASRLLVFDPQLQQIDDRIFRDIESLIEPGDLLVFNNTRVIPARLFGEKASGGKLEALIERVVSEHEVLAHLRSSRSPKPGQLVSLGGEDAEVVGREGALFHLRFTSDRPVLDILEDVGHMPLPPYMEREDAAEDRERYQTVYAEKPGAVAAPTAGLHFDDGLLDRLSTKGVNFAFVTLHVGAGTFQPVRVDDIRSHQMHAERIEVIDSVCKQVKAAQQRGGRVIAVGTTVVRSLESAASQGQLQPTMGETDIFITPGFSFQVVDALLTNFHEPESTLLMLVSALAGRDNLLAAYAHAVEQRYRFLSYGDGCLLYRKQ